ncbi:MAG TPA: bifunctional diaminohydroxyphosphoribosylaminopyrimidine deaminase/5-amino-6-(5-phosphoribosylamino)uracil reductase RibD [Steroidobacteraceae bacterium]|nr:bifunctional diaminohydroxyphosphoribosylaminopyrimidine deaminase/5-amino-6-(5-phosphoribosylamino)uracil reductase RibD [Steroidobacteraceae bacterium]
MGGWTTVDEQHMRHALGLAALGLHTTAPNPRVGCVLVRDGRVVGEGWHERAGGPHAEVRALQSAGDAARGATAYVSLEPCAAHGRTPPCTEALAAAGVRCVTYAADDPDPRMRGGAAALRAAGIEVAGGLLAAEARELNIGFFSRHERGRPWVRVKLAASLDGRTALADGRSQWITGEAARADVQLQRARSSVVLSGAGTVLRDDPALNVRIDGATRQPLRAVLDSTLRVPPSARVYAPPGPAAVFTASADAARIGALRQAGVQVEQLAAAEGGVDLSAVLARLAALQANEVWVEAGARLAGALLAAQLADELIVYLAPCLLGPQGLPLAQLAAPAGLDERLRLRYVAVDRVGADLRIMARPAMARD